MKSIESNIGSMVTRQLNTGLEELKRVITEPGRDRLSLLQSQMNDLVEQLRQHSAYEMEEVRSLLRESKTVSKQDAQAQSELMARMHRDNEVKFKDLAAQLKEFVHALKDSACETKEQVSKAEANLSSKLTDQHQSLQTVLEPLKRYNESTETEKPLAAVASANEYIPCNMQECSTPLKLEVLVAESLNILEFLRQQVYRHRKELWVSRTIEWGSNCGVVLKDISPNSGLDVTLRNAGSIFRADKEVFTVANFVNWRDVHVQITFRSSHSPAVMFSVDVECVKTVGNTSFVFKEITSEALSNYPGARLVFRKVWQTKCDVCSEIKNPHISARFEVEQRELVEGGFVKNDELKLSIDFK
ncbi:hypothetical protein MTO96_042752 [Rhipicephalus appendiculatus]